MRPRVAVLGATGHVGKCLTASLLARGAYELTAVARNAPRLQAFLGALPGGDRVRPRSFDEFLEGEFDVVVNCVGVGNPATVASSGEAIFALTERFDALVMDYLRRRPDARCVSFSSGAAYCGEFLAPVDEGSASVVHLNAVSPADFYGVAKLASEVKHRAAKDLAIVDFRLFGLFSRYIDLTARFFMTDVFRAIADGSPLSVGPENIVRDYIDPDDMAALLVAVIDAEPRNDVYDLYSAQPVAKFELLDDFSARYGLTYDVFGGPAMPTATGVKPRYYSTNQRARTIGYEPTHTSSQTLIKEIDVLLERYDGGRA